MFPGAAAVHLVESRAFGMKSEKLVPWLSSTAARFLFPSAEYGRNPKLAGRLRDITDRPGKRFVIFRYTRPFTRSGLAENPGAGLFVGVDVDDLEEHRFHTAFARLFGTYVAERLAEPLILRRIANLIQQHLRKASLVWVSAPEDQAALTGFPTAVLPNVPYFPARPTRFPGQSGPEVLFVGTFGHGPNRTGVRWFLKNVWPKVLAEVPEARFRIVGMGDWASLAPEFRELVNVDYVGRVEHVAHEYDRARLAVSPIDEGGGSKIKVIEACSFARPVVCTSHSIRGFGELQAHLSLANTPAEFAGACIRYLKDAELADSTGRRLQSLQQADYSRDANEDRIRQAIEKICRVPRDMSERPHPSPAGAAR
jgi:glycosyltransferase involved in cell wall biosynthesis